MIMLSMENNFENKRFGEMFWNNWITGISNLIESNSYYFEYEKINTMFEMSLSSYVNWNYEPETPMNITTKYDGKSFWRHNSDY